MLPVPKKKRPGRDLRSAHHLDLPKCSSLTTGSLKFQLLLTTLIIIFSLCKSCSFGHKNAIDLFLCMYYVVNQIFQSFDCIFVLFICNK